MTTVSSNMRLLFTFILFNFEITNIACNESFGKNATQRQASCYTCEFKWNRYGDIAIGDKRCIYPKKLSQLSYIINLNK